MRLSLDGGAGLAGGGRAGGGREGAFFSGVGLSTGVGSKAELKSNPSPVGVALPNAAQGSQIIGIT
jgi:hypothetical protein